MLLNEIKSLEEVEVTLRVNLMLPALADKLRYVIDALIQPQGEWFDLTDDEVVALEREVGCFAIGQLGAVIAKFKEKNTPQVVPQVVTEGNASEVRSTDTGEPVAWLIPGSVTTLPELAIANGKNAISLYTTPPSVEALMQELSDSEHDVQRLLDLVGKLDEEREAAIEATKEKAAKVCEEINMYTQHQSKEAYSCAYACGAAIRSMK